MTESGPKTVGLIGWPVEHSASPAMHNAAFERLGLDWLYVLLPAEPGNLQAVVDALRQEPFRGANVTVPHKQAIMAYLDGVTEAVRGIGAVNTIIADRGRLTGHNTDGDGFLAALREAGFEPAGRQALVLGAGGAARSVVCALASEGCAVTIHNRSIARARQLVEEMQHLGLEGPITWVQGEVGLARLDLGAFELLVNATSAGMWPRTDASPWPGGLVLPSHWTVFDLVYNPAETRLLARARSAGAKAVGGLEMLVHQGALAFALWTGQDAPVEVMRAAARQAIE
ncbi:MAG: shikimate dehydrogenase [Anaerolineae bacterium]